MADDLGNLDDCYVTKEDSGKRAIATTDPGILKNIDGSTNVYTKDYPFPPVEHYLYNSLAVVNLSGGPYPIGSNVINLQSGHGFVAPNRATFTEDFIVIKTNDPTNIFLPKRFYQSRVVNVVGDVIHLGIPLPFNLNSTDVISMERVNVDLNKTVGTLASPIEYKTEPPFGLLWELTRMMPIMICSSQPDDALYGNLPALPNGLTFSVEAPTLITESVVNIIDNSEWAASAFDVRYTSRSVPLGSWGVNTRKTFSGRDKWGIVVTLGIVEGHKFSVLVQDDLTGLTRHRVKIMGRAIVPNLI